MCCLEPQYPVIIAFCICILLYHWKSIIPKQLCERGWPAFLVLPLQARKPRLNISWLARAAQLLLSDRTKTEAEVFRPLKRVWERKEIGGLLGPLTFAVLMAQRCKGKKYFQKAQEKRNTRSVMILVVISYIQPERHKEANVPFARMVHSQRAALAPAGI